MCDEIAIQIVADKDISCTPFPLAVPQWIGIWPIPVFSSQAAEEPCHKEVISILLVSLELKFANAHTQDTPRRRNLLFVYWCQCVVLCSSYVRPVFLHEGDIAFKMLVDLTGLFTERLSFQESGKINHHITTYQSELWTEITSTWDWVIAFQTRLLLRTAMMHCFHLENLIKLR